MDLTCSSQAVDLRALREEICRIGHDLFWMGLQSPRSGNLSVRFNDHFLITRRGSSLRALDWREDVIEAGLFGPLPAEASSESKVHREIYRGTGALAVVHAHPPHAIALSFHTDLIKPIHNEGRALLGDVPVTQSNAVEGEGEDPEPVVKALALGPAVVVRGHGAFTAAADLETAFYHMGLLEHAAKIVLLAGRGLVD